MFDKISGKGSTPRNDKLIENDILTLCKSGQKIGLIFHAFPKACGKIGLPE
jgi:hypothetical protein